MTRPPARGADERSGAGRLIAAFAVGTATCTAARFVLSPLLPRIIDGLGISPSQAGIAITVMGLLVAISRYPAGRISDQLSRKTVLVIGLGLAAMGLLLVATATTYLWFVVGVGIVGLGAGSFRPVAFAGLSDRFTDRRGRAIGINSAAISFGGVIASGLAVATLGIGWRAAPLGLIAVAIVALALLHQWYDEPVVVGRIDLNVRETVARLVGIVRLRRVLAAAALFTFSWQGLVNFLPAFLEAEKGFPPALAGNAFAAIFVAGMVTNPIAGTLNDRFGFKHVAIASVVLSISGLGLLLAAGSVPWAVGSVVVLAVGLGGFWTPMTTGIMNVVPAGSRGGDFGAASTIYVALGSLGPAYVGTVAEVASYETAFLGVVACLVATAGFLWTLEEV